MIIASRQCIRIFKIDLTNQCYILGRTLAYSSAYALCKLYPTSNLKLFTPAFVPEDPNAKFTGYIPLKELDITYSRSSGAGGQHVNCTNSKVDIRFQIKTAKWLSEEIKEKLMEKHKHKLTKEGYLRIRSEVTRSQILNLADSLEKLRNMIWSAIAPPQDISSESEEFKRKQLLKAARKRLQEKRKHSEIKQFRKPSSMDF